MNTAGTVAYKPFGAITGMLAGVLAGIFFKRVWKLVAHEQRPPKANDRSRGWTEVVLAATLEGAVFGAVKAAVERAGATGFAKTTGVWPGPTRKT
jgi:hypothetical protein